MLDIYAGKVALKQIQAEGFQQSLFSSFLGASGGPKWFSLFELDKYLFGDFFAERTLPLNLIGSSAGAFRSACFAQNDPVAAITRMAESYSQTVYSKNAQPKEITDKALELLDFVLGDNGIDEIIDNKVFKAHFLVNKTNGLVAYENKVLQLLGLAKSAVLNRFNRRFIGKQYQRIVFREASSEIEIEDYCQFSTDYIDLTRANLRDVLLASGSIPLVMQGIKDIAGAPSGMYRDGGIIDYHFDFKLKNNDGLILYPHFNAEPKAGWFDKNLSRKVQQENYDNVLMLVPSRAFIGSLPYQKIPDRKDFTKMEPTQRIKYWQTVLQETQRLAESFHHFVSDQQLDRIKPFV